MYLYINCHICIVIYVFICQLFDTINKIITMINAITIIVSACDKSLVKSKENLGSIYICTFQNCNT